MRPLDVYALLPKENFKECGEPTCMAFAFKLLQRKAAMDECPRLVEDRYAKHREALSAVLGV